MCLWAIIPVKPLRRGKSRLAGILSDEQRYHLNQAMLVNTLRILSKVSEIEQVLVVSRDQSALTLARDYSARTLLEDGNPGLNTALRRATKVVQAYSACGVLILPADLPLLTVEAIDRLTERAGEPPEIVIAPDRRQTGTNGLLIRPPGAIDYYFGAGSFQRHMAQATQKGVAVKIVEDNALSLDLDLPEDFDILKEMDNLPVSLEYFEAVRANYKE